MYKFSIKIKIDNKMSVILPKNPICNKEKIMNKIGRFRIGCDEQDIRNQNK